MKQDSILSNTSAAESADEAASVPAERALMVAGPDDAALTELCALDTANPLLDLTSKQDLVRVALARIASKKVKPTKVEESADPEAVDGYYAALRKFFGPEDEPSDRKNYEQLAVAFLWGKREALASDLMVQNNGGDWNRGVMALSERVYHGIANHVQLEGSDAVVTHPAKKMLGKYFDDMALPYLRPPKKGRFGIQVSSGDVYQWYISLDDIFLNRMIGCFGWQDSLKKNNFLGKLVDKVTDYARQEFMPSKIESNDFRSDLYSDVHKKYGKYGDLSGRPGVYLFESLAKVAIPGERVCHSQEDCLALVDWMIQSFSGVADPRLKAEAVGQPRMQAEAVGSVLPNVTKLKAVRDQLKVHMVRLGIKNDCFKAIADDQKPRDRKFFEALSGLLFGNEVAAVLTEYDGVWRKEKFRKIWEAKQVDPEIANLYEACLIVYQYYEGGRVQVENGLSQQVEAGEVLMEIARMLSEYLTRTMVNLESHLQYGVGDVDLGPVLGQLAGYRNADGLSSAINGAKHSADYARDVAGARAELDEDPLREKFRILEAGQQGKALPGMSR